MIGSFIALSQSFKLIDNAIYRTSGSVVLPTNLLVVAMRTGGSLVLK
jgi:hypothetical protein